MKSNKANTFKTFEPTKSQAMTVGNSVKSFAIPPVTFGCDKVPEHDVVKLLGVSFDKNSISVLTSATSPSTRGGACTFLIVPARYLIVRAGLLSTRDLFGP